MWWSRIGSRSTPRARWHFVTPWVSRSRLTTIAPYCSLPSYAPTLPSRGGLCRHDGGPVDAAPGPERPDDPCRLVGQCHPDQHTRLASEKPAKPDPRLRHGICVPLDDDGVDSEDEQSPERALSHLRRRPEAVLAAGRVLRRREAQPRREVPRAGSVPSRGVGARAFGKARADRDATAGSLMF